MNNNNNKKEVLNIGFLSSIVIIVSFHPLFVVPGPGLAVIVPAALIPAAAGLAADLAAANLAAGLEIYRWLVRFSWQIACSSRSAA